MTDPHDQHVVSEMDDDGAHDRVQRRAELRRAWTRLAARYCRAMAEWKSPQDERRAFETMMSAYHDWKGCH